MLSVTGLKSDKRMEPRMYSLGGRGRSSPRYNIKHEKENHIGEVRIAKGLTQKELSNLAGVSMGTISKYELGYVGVSRIRKTGLISGFNPTAQKIADALNVSLGDLFPREVCATDRDNLTDDQILELSTSTQPFQVIDNTKLDIKEALKHINQRERQVIIFKYLHEMTSEEIGKKFNISKSRISQIEIKALRKLKHPSRKRYLYGYVKE